MRLLVSLLFAVGLLGAVRPEFRYAYHVVGDEPTSWPAVLSSIGLTPAADGPSRLLVLPAGTAADPAVWMPRIAAGALVILEGDSPLAEALGIVASRQRVTTRSVLDVADPKLPIIWQESLDLPRFTLPAAAKVYAHERWSRMPLMAGLRHGAGAVLWLAVGPGKQGHERFPYALQALVDLGLQPPYRTGRLWAFFDSSYRLRVDPDYFAERWRRAGIGALHVAAWHYHEPDPGRDDYLRKLIEACHRRAILVYAWVELPHVSEQFWQQHPQWREKTALLQDAHLDWRKLMNLQHPDCARAVAAGLSALVRRFDWDGVNLAELYFESLEGIDNPARFTPFNDNARAAFSQAHGVDPLTIVKDRKHALRAVWLDFRAHLAKQMQEEWLARLEAERRQKPHLDIVLTHVDDRFDTRMRELIGADAGRLLPLLDTHDFTFLIEDPATIWHLGPQRYPQIADKYKPLTTHREKLAIDINIVERYQDVYPTKQQTGTELFQLVNLSAKAFARVALYFENSILTQDLPLLPSAAAAVDRVDYVANRLVIESPRGVGIPWQGAAMVNGRLWPVAEERTLWLPPGPVAIEPATATLPLRVLDFNGELQTAAVRGGAVDLAYASAGRAIAVLDVRPAMVEIDGVEVSLPILDGGPGRYAMLLPRGQHLVTFSVPGSSRAPSPVSASPVGALHPTPPPGQPL
jgi:hypothetical protein